MKVLYILDYGTIGGATKAFVDMIQQMVKMGITPIVVTGKYNDLNEYLESKGIQTISAGHYTAIEPFEFSGVKSFLRFLKLVLRYVLSEILAIYKIQRKIDLKDIDIIHTNSARNTLGCYLSHIYKIKHLMHIREFGDKDFKCIKLNPFFYTILNHYTDVFVAVSDSVKAYWVSKGICAEKIIRIYDGINYDDIKPSLEYIKGEKIKLVIAGGVCEAKGQKIAIEAIAKLPQSFRELTVLDIYGWYDKKYLLSMIDIANRYGISGQIHYFGPVSDMHKRLEGYHIGLMCSRSEGFGLVTAEYMHACLAVVASNGGASPELIEDGITGLIFKNGDACNLSTCIKRLIEDDELRENCRRKAQEKATLLFTTERNALSIYEQYKIILNI